MKIAVIHPYLYRLARGGENFTQQFVNRLAAAGHTVDAYYWRNARDVVLFPPDERVRLHPLRTGRYYKEYVAFLHYARVVLSTRYDWTILNFASNGERAFLRTLRPRLHGRLMFIYHFALSASPNQTSHLVKNNAGAAVDCHVAVSSFVAQGVTEHLGVAPHIIPIGIDPGRFYEDADARQRQRAEFGIDPGQRVLLTIATGLEPTKNVDKMIRALPLLPPEVLYLVVASDVGRQAIFEDIAAEAGVSDRVRFVRPTPDINSYYNACDAYVLLSSSEALCQSSVEASAVGKPVVAPRLPPHVDCLSPLNTRFVDDISVPEQVAAAVRQAENPAPGDVRDFIVSGYGWPGIIARYEQLLTACPPAGSGHAVAGR